MREVKRACNHLANDVIEAFSWRKQVQPLALDILIAYNIMWQARLLYKIQRLGTDSYLLDWTPCLIFRGIVLLKVGNFITKTFPHYGIP